MFFSGLRHPRAEQFLLAVATVLSYILAFPAVAIKTTAFHILAER